MAVDGYLNFDTKIDTGGFRHGVQSLSSGLDRLKSELKSVAAAVGLAFGARELVRFGKTAVETAAAVNAANSAMTQTFGALEDAAVSAMQRVADESGIMRTRLQGAGTQIYAFAKASGMDSVQALSMMEDALRTAADSAAYYDRSLEETTESLKSFLKGNFANDAALGVSCTETTRNIAANKLYAKSYRDLSEAQKQLTLLQMVKDANALSGAEGQAAREAEGWENVIGNLKEAWRQLLAVIGQPGLTVAVSVVQQLTAWLTALTSAAERAIATISEIAGFELQAEQTAAVKSNITQSVAEQEALTEAAEETAAAQEKILTGYDEIHRLAGGTEVLPSVGGIVPAAVAVQPDLRSADKAAKRISERIGELTLPIRLAWSARGAETVGRVTEMMQELRGLTDSVGISWEKVWKNGTGRRSAEHLLGIVGGISGTVGGLAGSFRRAWDENDRGTRIVQGIWNGFNNVLETGDRFWKSTSDWAHRLDFGPLLDSCGELSEAFADLADPDTGLGNDLLWLYENVLQPLGKWTLEKALPTTISATADALDGMRKIWIKVREPLRKLYEQFLKPVAELTGDAALALISGLGKGLQSIGDSMTDKQAEVLVKAAAGITAIVAAVKGIGKGAALFASAKAFFGGAGGLGALLGSELGAVGLPKTLMASAAALIGGYTLGDIIFNDLLGLDKFTTRFGEWLYDFTHGTDTSEWSQFWQDFGADAAGLIDSGWKDIESWWDKLFTEDEATDKELALLRVQGGVEGLSRSLDDTSEEESSFSENWISGFNDIEDTTKTTWENTKESLSGGWGKLKGFFTGYRSNWKTGWDEIKQKASGTWDSVKTKLSSGWESVKSGFSDFKSNWETGWSTIKSYCSEKWDRIKEKITNSSAWETVSGSFNGFRENWISGLDTISRKTANFRDTVKRIFEHIWSGLDGKGGIKSVINSILSGLETMLNGAVSGLNKAISGINSISVDTPDWIPLIGGKHIGFSIPELSRASLPRLATGTVVPANYGEFAAILGDNKHEAEIISPISAMKQAFLEALAESSAGQGSTAPVTEIIRLVLDGKTIAETVRKHQLGRGRITNGGMA